MIDIIPTVVPDSREAIENAAAQWGSVAPMLHIDVTDGDFASPATWVPSLEEALPEGIAWEAHLMVRDPHAWGERFIRAGVERIIAHAEALPEAGAHLLDEWRTAGAREVGIALKLDTPLAFAEHVLPYADFVLFMSIREIGAQGQRFDEAVLPKVRDAREHYPNLIVAVDGGIHAGNIATLIEAGATHFCIGAAIAQAPNPHAYYQELRALTR